MKPGSASASPIRSKLPVMKVVFSVVGPNRVSDPFRQPSAAAMGISETSPTNGWKAEVARIADESSQHGAPPPPNRRSSRAITTPAVKAPTTISSCPASVQLPSDRANPVAITVPVMGATKACRPRYATAFT